MNENSDYKISELIEILAKLLEIHGDLPIRVFNHEYYEWDNIADVVEQKDSADDRLIVGIK